MQKNHHVFLVTFLFVLHTTSVAGQSFLKNCNFSAGVNYSWTTREDPLELVGEADWLFEGYIAPYISVGYNYFNPPEKVVRRWNDWEFDKIGCMITVEKIKSNFQYWDRTTVGKMDAIVMRIVPFIMYYKYGNTNFHGMLNIIGINILLRGDISMLKGYYLYYPHEDYLYLVDEIELRQKDVGWSVLGMGIYYEISKLNFHIGLETTAVETLQPEVKFKTYGGDFIVDPWDLNGLFPVKLRITFNF